MHDVLRTRVLRKLESLPEDQVYQVLDYIEFLESKYAPDISSDTTALQSFAEKLEDQLRRRTVSPGSLREAFQLISAADKVLSNVANRGKELICYLYGPAEGNGSKPGTAAAPKDGGKPQASSGTKGEGEKKGSSGERKKSKGGSQSG